MHKTPGRQNPNKKEEMNKLKQVSFLRQVS